MADRKNEIVLLGDMGVGKWTIFTRFKTGVFTEDTYHPSEDRCKKTVTVDGKEVTVRCRFNLYPVISE